MSVCDAATQLPRDLAETLHRGLGRRREDYWMAGLPALAQWCDALGGALNATGDDVPEAHARLFVATERLGDYERTVLLGKTLALEPALRAAGPACGAFFEALTALLATSLVRRLAKRDQ